MDFTNDTPSITVIARVGGGTVSLSCTERPGWNVRADSFSRALFEFARNAQRELQDPFASSLGGAPWDVYIPANKLPALLTLRFTWSNAAWAYSVRISELPKAEVPLGRIDTLVGAIYYVADNLRFWL